MFTLLTIKYTLKRKATTAALIEKKQDKHSRFIRNELLQCALSVGFRLKLPLFGSKDFGDFHNSLNQALQRFFNLL